MGFPHRPLLSEFGEASQNYAPVMDPTRDLDIAHWVLMKAQVAGMGLLSPRVLAKLTVSGTPALLARGEAWNPNQLTSGVYANPTFNVVGTGHIQLIYPTLVPDETGANQPVAFSWGFGWLSADPPTTVKKVQVEPLGATPSTLSVCVFSAADALENGNNVWIMAG